MGIPDFSTIGHPVAVPVFAMQAAFLQFQRFPVREATALALLIAAFLLLLLFFLFRWSIRSTEGAGEGANREMSPDASENLSDELDLNSPSTDSRSRRGGGASSGFPTAEIRETREMEQERWNLPGFHSMDLLSPPVGPEEIGDFVSERHLREGMGAGAAMYGSAPAGKGTIVQRYRFSELPFTTNVYSDVEAFARELLSRASDLLAESDLTLHLRNGRGQFPPVLGKRGTLFVSGEALREPSLLPAVMEKLQAGVSILSEEGESAYFPLFSGNYLLGFLHAMADESLFNRELLQQVWGEIRMFGDILYQAKIFEQSTRDPESTLYNGMQFHADLLRFFRMRESYRTPVSLYLIRYATPDGALFMRLYGLALAAYFPGNQNLYRIARDMTAVLGPELSSGKMEELLESYETYVSIQNSVHLRSGGALLSPETESVEVWFQRAASALEYAGETGPGGRRSILYEENLSGYGSTL